MQKTQKYKAYVLQDSTGFRPSTAIFIYSTLFRTDHAPRIPNNAKHYCLHVLLTYECVSVSCLRIDVYETKRWCTFVHTTSQALYIHVDVCKETAWPEWEF